MLPSFQRGGDEDSCGNNHLISLIGASKVAESHVHDTFYVFLDNMLNYVPDSPFAKLILTIPA